MAADTQTSENLDSSTNEGPQINEDLEVRLSPKLKMAAVQFVEAFRAFESETGHEQLKAHVVAGYLGKGDANNEPLVPVLLFELAIPLAEKIKNVNTEAKTYPVNGKTLRLIDTYRLMWGNELCKTREIVPILEIAPDSSQKGKWRAASDKCLKKFLEFATELVKRSQATGSTKSRAIKLETPAAELIKVSIKSVAGQPVVAVNGEELPLGKTPMLALLALALLHHRHGGYTFKSIEFHNLRTGNKPTNRPSDTRDSQLRILKGLYGLAWHTPQGNHRGTFATTNLEIVLEDDVSDEAISAYLKRFPIQKRTSQRQSDRS